MEELRIANFRFGWDQRRTELTSQPGTLETLENLFVNSGAELEKRLAFVQAANEVAFAATTFGLEATEDGLVTFGSAAAPATLPTGVTYQRLQDGLGGNMLSVVQSTNLNGKAFVIATFRDSTNVQTMTRAFYDGTLVASFSNGIVWQGATLTTLGADLVTEITEYLEGWTSVNASGAVTVKSPIGVTFVPTATEDSTAGGFSPAPYRVDQNGAAVPGVCAAAAVLITGTSGGGTIQVSSTYETPDTDLTGGNVAWNATATQTAIDVAAAINARTAIHGYRSIANAGKFSVYAPPGSQYNGSALSVTFAAITVSFAVSPDADTTTPLLSVSPTAVQKTIQSRQGRSMLVRSDNVTALGGTPPYTWAEYSSGTANGIVISAATGAQVTFSKQLSIDESVTGRFKVTDNAAVTVAFDVYLSLEFYTTV